MAIWRGRRKERAARLFSEVAIRSSFGTGNKLNGGLFLKPKSLKVFWGESNHPYLPLRREWIGHNKNHWDR
jgi:hypothetical protein